MRISTVWATAFALTAIIGQTTSAHAEGCSLDNSKLICAKGGNSQAITAAFSSDETSKLLSHPIEKLSAFKKPSDLETFRKSIEKNWLAVQKAERQERSKMLRRKISSDQFEAWSATYKQAEENYSHAINFYRTLVWHGKNGKPAPKDTDS